MSGMASVSIRETVNAFVLNKPSVSNILVCLVLVNTALY